MQARELTVPLRNITAKARNFLWRQGIFNVKYRSLYFWATVHRRFFSGDRFGRHFYAWIPRQTCSRLVCGLRNHWGVLMHEPCHLVYLPRLKTYSPYLLLIYSLTGSDCQMYDSVCLLSIHRSTTDTRPCSDW